MNLSPRLSAIVCCAALSSCAPPPGTTVREYAAMTRGQPVTENPIIAEMSVEEPGNGAISLGAKRVTMGEPVRYADKKDFIYPAAYEAAKASSDLTALTPATPVDFKTVETGIEAELTASREGSLILLRGTVSVVTFEGFSKTGGALGQPVLDDQGRMITENRIEMPMFATYTTPVYVAIRPGESAGFEISHPRPGTRMNLSLKPEP